MSDDEANTSLQRSQSPYKICLLIPLSDFVGCCVTAERAEQICWGHPKMILGC
jgi:hypothetical protein